MSQTFREELRELVTSIDDIYSLNYRKPDKVVQQTIDLIERRMPKEEKITFRTLRPQWQQGYNQAVKEQRKILEE